MSNRIITMKEFHSQSSLSKAENFYNVETYSYLDLLLAGNIRAVDLSKLHELFTLNQLPYHFDVNKMDCLSNKLPFSEVPASEERRSIVSSLLHCDKEAGLKLIRMIKSGSRFVIWFHMRYGTNIETSLTLMERCCTEAKLILEPSLAGTDTVKFLYLLDVFSNLNIKRVSVNYNSLSVDTGGKVIGKVAVREGILHEVALWAESELYFHADRKGKDIAGVKIDKFTKSSYRKFDKIIERYHTFINNKFGFSLSVKMTFDLDKIYFCSVENYFSFKERIQSKLNDHVAANPDKEFNIFVIVRGGESVRYSFDCIHERFERSCVTLAVRMKGDVDADSVGSPTSDATSDGEKTYKYKYVIDVGSCTDKNFNLLGYEEEKGSGKRSDHVTGVHITGKLAKPYTKLTVGDKEFECEYNKTMAMLTLRYKEGIITLINFFPEEKPGGIVLEGEENGDGTPASGSLSIDINFKIDDSITSACFVENSPQELELSIEDDKLSSVNSDGSSVMLQWDIMRSNHNQFLDSMAKPGNQIEEPLKYKDLDKSKYYMLVNYSGEIYETEVSAREREAKAHFSFDPDGGHTSSNMKLLFSFEKEELEKQTESNKISHDFCLVNPRVSKELKQLEKTFIINEGDLPLARVKRVNLINLDKSSVATPPATPPSPSSGAATPAVPSNQNTKSAFDYKYKFRAIFAEKYKDKLTWAYEISSIEDYSKKVGDYKNIGKQDNPLELIPNQDLGLSDADKKKLENSKEYKLVIFAYLKDYQENPVYESRFGKTHYTIEMGYPRITKEMLLKVFTGAKGDGVKEKMIEEMETELNRFNDKGIPMYVTYKLDTKKRLDHFFAQAWHEAGNGKLTLGEGFDYRALKLYQVTAGNIIDKFGCSEEMAAGPFEYFRGHNDSFRYGRITQEEIHRYPKIVPAGTTPHNANQKEIANRAYGGRKDLGNTGICMTENEANLLSCDGWKYRGQGLIQLTGRKNFTNFQKYAFDNKWITEGENFVNNPELTTQHGKYTLLSAVYFWNKSHKKGALLYKLADDDNPVNNMENYIKRDDKGSIEINIMVNSALKLITYTVNGGYNGLKFRQNALERINNEKIFADFE